MMIFNSNKSLGKTINNVKNKFLGVKDAELVESEPKSLEKIHEYEKDNMGSNYNLTLKKIWWGLVIFGGIVVIFILLSFAEKIWILSPTAGKISCLAFLILFILFYLRPIYEFTHSPQFDLEPKINKTKKSNTHNRKLRFELAKRLVKFNEDVGENAWYDKESINNLKTALSQNDDTQLTTTLIKLMNGQVKDASSKIIRDNAVQAGLYAALSQSSLTDALLVCAVNFKMVKDLIFLYGFRPSEARLIRIFLHASFNAIAAYSISGAEVGGMVAAKMSARAIPFVKEATGFVADACVQAISNGMLTLWIGFKTTEYLMEEYKLGALLDGIDVLDDEEEFNETYVSIRKKMVTKFPNLSDMMEMA